MDPQSYISAVNHVFPVIDFIKMMCSLVLITVGYLKPGENSGRHCLSPVQALLGQTKHCTCTHWWNPLFPTANWDASDFYLGGGAGRRHPRKSSPALTTSVRFSHTPAAVTHQTQHLPDGQVRNTDPNPGNSRVPLCCKIKEHKLYLKTEKNGHAVKSTRSIFLIQSIFLPSAGLQRGAQMHSGSLTRSIMKQTASGVYKQAE